MLRNGTQQSLTMFCSVRRCTINTADGMDIEVARWMTIGGEIVHSSMEHAPTIIRCIVDRHF